jgi:hypothetical protein
MVHACLPQQPGLPDSPRSEPNRFETASFLPDAVECGHRHHADQPFGERCQRGNGAPDKMAKEMTDGRKIPKSIAREF